MGRLTKLRAPQTRASEKYDTTGENLATDHEVEVRVRKHSALFHHNRDDNTHFNFDILGNLETILVKSSDDNKDLQKSEFIFDINGNLEKIIKEVWDEESELYVKMVKDFIFDMNGNLLEIQNRIII